MTTRMTIEYQLHSLPSFAAVHMHLYLKDLAIPLQRSRNPTVKIENLQNLLRFFEKYFNGSHTISAPSSSVKGTLLAAVYLSSHVF